MADLSKTIQIVFEAVDNTGTGIAALANRLPGELSQGERQRVALCRALVTRPALILADEPTGSLDPDNQARSVALLRHQAKSAGATLIMVTHDLNTLAGLASHVAVLADHRILAFGTRAEIMTVDHPFVTGFFGADRRKLL